ncbi:Protein CBG25214 [Caenorhabditis briggsae]|uniref:Protein CBG25214 n=1 Tax=Caenorhabditis briggsae TaxID=6238 RepID=B6IJH2_CAEBR|nr:Protein CBG25214 [Caenorhabditis briggsae]CAS00052.1 Protein CBG25214 [Caenorhabditis briggsae]
MTTHHEKPTNRKIRDEQKKDER